MSIRIVFGTRSARSIHSLVDYQDVVTPVWKLAMRWLPSQPQ